MISHITGTILDLDLRYAVIATGGIGYKIYTPTETIEHLSHEKGPISLWIHTIVREDALDLYGFIKKSDREFFELLLTVSGIGPKSALGILNSASPDTIKDAIFEDDASHLTKVSGIGKKTAEKIIRELKEKVGISDTKDGIIRTSGKQTESSMAIEALMSLGFTADDAREAVKKIDKTLSTQEQVKLALKTLQNN
jgi:Holliday junction DNA helicase RuvA